MEIENLTNYERTKLMLLDELEVAQMNLADVGLHIELLKLHIKKVKQLEKEAKGNLELAQQLLQEHEDANG